MARLRQKNCKRYRVQISVSKEVWQRYNENQLLAGKLGVEVDYSPEFSQWLARQNEQVAKELQQFQQPEEIKLQQQVKATQKTKADNCSHSDAGDMVLDDGHAHT